MSRSTASAFDGASGRAIRSTASQTGLCIRLAVLVGLAMLVGNVAAAQDPATAVVDECRRMALEEYTRTEAEYDSNVAKNKEIFDNWQHKASTLLAAAKTAKAEFGKFGDPRIFDNYARSPAKIAGKISKDVESTLQAVSSSLTALETQLSATPRDAVLYCSYVTVFFHRNILQKLARYAGVHELALLQMESYFRIRIAVSSAISESEYRQDRDAINEALLDLYEGEVGSAAHTQALLIQLTKQ